MLFDSLDKIKRNSILSAILLIALGVVIIICPKAYIGVFVKYVVLSLIACILFIGSCILASVDIYPKTSSGMPLISVAGIVFSIALAIYSVRKLTKKK